MIAKLLHLSGSCCFLLCVFLEILQLLTLQVHTREECTSFHRAQPELDEETELLSSGLSINSYHFRMDHCLGKEVEKTVARYSDFSLPCTSIDPATEATIPTDFDSGHGRVARNLASDGLKWLLRFVNALVDGVPRDGAAAKSASSGIPWSAGRGLSLSGSDWSLDPEIRATVSGMVEDLGDLCGVGSIPNRMVDS